MRAVREALRVAGADDEALEEAEKAVYSVLNNRGPYGLVQAPEEVIAKAADAFAAALPYPQAGRVEIDLEDWETEPAPPSSDRKIDQEFDPANMPAEFTPSAEAVRTALALMAMADGSAQTAWFYAKLLARNTGQSDLYVEVGRVLGDAFTFQA
jgi:hypothetical protein